MYRKFTLSCCSTVDLPYIYMESRDIPVLFYMGLGLGAAGILLLLFVRRMFNRHKAYSYYCVLGFLLGTVVLIFPGFWPFPTQLWYFMLFAAGGAVTLMMGRLSRRG